MGILPIGSEGTGQDARPARAGSPPSTSLLPVIAACLVAAALTAPVLVPFAEAAVRSERLAEVRETPEMTTSPLPRFDSAVLLLNPRFFGELPLERPWGLTVNESICAFSGILTVAACFAAPLWIAARRRWRDPEMLYLLALVVCLGVILNWSAVTAAFHAVAGLAPTGRMRIGICWFGSLLLAATLDDLRVTAKRTPLLLGILVTAAALLMLILRVGFPSVAHRDAALLAVMPSLAVLLAATLLPLRRTFALAILLVPFAIDLWLPVARWNPALPSRELYPKTPLIARLQELRGTDKQPFRILGTSGQLYPNTGAMFGFDDVRVHDPMASRRYLLFLQSMIGWEPRNYYEKWNDTQTSVIDYLNARWVVTEPGRELAAPRYVEHYSGRDGRIYENRDVLPLFFPVRHVLAGGDVRTHTDWRYTALVSRLPRAHQAELLAPWTDRDATVAVRRRGQGYELTVDAPRKTLIASSIENWPGWRANDFPVVEVNGLFFGFVVPPGRHEIAVRYRPLSFYASAGVAVVGLAGLIAGAFFQRQRRRPAAVIAASATPPQNDQGL
jgi:hypothetical protein